MPEKFVVTFKPGKEMEERVRELERQAVLQPEVRRPSEFWRIPPPRWHPNLPATSTRIPVALNGPRSSKEGWKTSDSSETPRARSRVQCSLDA